MKFYAPAVVDVTQTPFEPSIYNLCYNQYTRIIHEKVMKNLNFKGPQTLLNQRERHEYTDYAALNFDCDLKCNRNKLM